METNKSYQKYVREGGIHFVPVWRILGFSGANLAGNLYLGITMIMSFYLNGYVGMAVVLASSLSTILRLWDGITDPIIGFVVDRTGNRFGKTRFCLVLGGVILFINSFLMFNVTDRLPEGGIIRPTFFIVFSLLFYVGYTFLNISMHVGNVCLTNDPAQRPILSIIGTTLVRIMRAAMQMVVASLAVKYGSMMSAQLFHEYWLIVAVSATICIVIAYISIAPKDIPYFNETKSQKTGDKAKLSDYLTILKSNRPLRMMIVANTTDKLAVTCKTSAITLILYGIVAGNYKLSGGWTMYTTVIGLIMMIVGVGAIGRKFGLRRAMQIGSAGAIVFDAIAVLLWLFGDPKTLNLPGYVNGYGEAFTGFTVFTVLIFLASVLGNGFAMISSSSVLPMIADVNDYEASVSGKFVPGMVGTVFSFIDKLISAFGPTVVGIGFAIIGFGDKFPDLNTPYSFTLLIFALVFYYGFAILGNVCNLIAMKFYDLTPEKMKEVEKTVANMREAE